jgi:suppressor for copper-sensitivity B
MALIRHGRKGKRVIRRAFLSTAAGIVSSFLLLAAATVALKASGQAIGWGVQFQQPFFLIFMIFVLTCFAANLWGFFQISAPRFAQAFVDPSRHPKLTGDFASGALATLLATPCSAPFLGTAISFALAAGWIEIFSVFAALGLGMAVPYLLIALRPRSASFLPAAGKWMDTLSHILGFGLAGTALWLVFVLDAQIGNLGSGLVALGMLALLGVIALRHKGMTRKVTYPLIGLIVAGTFSLAVIATTPKHLETQYGLWRPFDEAAIPSYLNQGKIVFIDVTASWCLTCKVNKRFALADKEVTQKLFYTDKIIAMQADWTNPDPVVTAFLHKHNRFGVPFNIVFWPARKDGLPLPELLTPQIVLDALQTAEQDPIH